MSICIRLNKNLATFGTNALQLSSFCAKRIWKIGASILGKKGVGALQENVAEFVAYYAGAELAAPYGKWAGGNIGSAVGTSTATGLALVTASRATAYTNQRTSHLSLPARILISTTMSLSIICCAISLTSEPLQQMGTDVGERLGESIGYYGGGIVAAFCAIKLTGSEEVLWHHSSKVRTYFIKTVFSMVTSALINELFPTLQTPYVQPMTDLIIGSLAYNSLDLFETCLNLKKGRLLDGVIPKTLPDPGFFDLAFKVVRSQLISMPINSIASRAPVFLNLFLSDLTPMLQTALEQLVDAHIPPTSTNLNPLRHLTREKVSQAIMRGVNLYSDILTLHPELLSRAEASAHFLRRATSVLEQPLKNYSAFKNHTLTQLFEQLTDFHLGPNLPRDLSEIPRFISSHQIDVLAEKCTKTIQSKEEAFFGFSLTGERESEKLHDLLNRHLENTLACIALCALTIPIPLKDEEVRKFHANVTDILSSLYQPILGSTLSSGIAAFIKHQVSNSDLS